MLNIKKILKNRKWTAVFFLAAITALCACSKTADPDKAVLSSGTGNDPQIQKDSENNHYDAEPYAVRSFLKELAFVDRNTGTGFYGRYTELKVEGDAPETFCNAIAESNRRAEEAVRLRGDQVRENEMASGSNTDGYQYVTYGYISAVTRADQTAFSILETEFEKGIGKSDSEITYQFHGLTCDTQTGGEIALADLAGDDETCSEKLRKALSAKYGIEGLAKTDPSDYAWTADALGIRFYFNSDAVSKDQRSAIGDYSARAVSTSFSFEELPDEKAGELSSVPESYIAMIDPETEYELPHGNQSVLLTKQGDDVVIRISPDKGETKELIIEYADALSDFYIIRAEGGFYLFRERIGYQEGFFYDFSRPDGGYGRFAYNTSQYFDSFMREIYLALPYDPYCAHMAEARRSFGESVYDKASFVPHGHYSFPNDPDARYKKFLLTDEELQIDSNNKVCRLLEDFTATKIDENGKEAGQITVPAGRTMTFESVIGEAARYDDPPKRSYSHTFLYNCRLTDGTYIRFQSTTESLVSAEGAYLTRFTEPVTSGEAQFENAPEERKPFTVQIGGRDYPLIPDYSRIDHSGEEIDFGSDIWWQVEEYPGRYVCTDEDLKEMEGAYFTQDALAHPEQRAELRIFEDGRVEFDYLGQAFKGMLPEKRYYKTGMDIPMESESESRTFRILLREGKDHTPPERIEFFSEGLPATNEPSRVPPISVYMTKEGA